MLPKKIEVNLTLYTTIDIIMTVPSTRRLAIFGTICNVKNTRGKVLLLVKVQIERNFIKSNTPLCVFFTFSKLYKWYQIAQTITESYGCLFLIICCQTPVNIFNVRKAGHFPHQVWLSNGLRYRFQGISARKNEPKNVFFFDVSSMHMLCKNYMK